MSDSRDSNRLKALERTIVLDDLTRQRRQRKALEALEKDNFQEDHPSASIYVSDFRLQLNKKFQQRFTLENENDTAGGNNQSMFDSSTSSATTGGGGGGATSGATDSTSGVESSKKKRLKAESKLRYRKNLATMLDEEHALSINKKFNYFSICAPPSKFPARKFCAVCGFESNYKCIQCGSKYCSTKCLQAHRDTRCLKWTA